MKHWLGELLWFILGIVLLAVVALVIGWALVSALSCWGGGGTWIPTAWPDKCLEAGR